MFSDRYTYELHGPKGNITLLPQTDGTVTVIEGADFAESLPEEISSRVVADHRSDEYLALVKSQIADSQVTQSSSDDAVDHSAARKGSDFSP